MILPISNFSDRKISFNAKSEEEKNVSYDKDTLLKIIFQLVAELLWINL